jgi:hypothetical protein
MPAHTHNFSAGINIKNNFFTHCFIAAYTLECSAFHIFFMIMWIFYIQNSNFKTQAQIQNQTQTSLNFYILTSKLKLKFKTKLKLLLTSKF